MKLIHSRQLSSSSKTQDKEKECPLKLAREYGLLCSNDQLDELIPFLQTERCARTERDQKAALQQIQRIVEEFRLPYPGRKPSTSDLQLRPGDIYRNPDNATQEYIVGNGRPPNWFILLRAEKRLPPPIGRTLLKRNMKRCVRADNQEPKSEH